MKRLLVLAFLLTAGCGPTPRETCTSDEDLPDVGDVTWHADVRPIVEQACVRCHRYGGLGGFSLESFADAYEWRSAMARAVESRTMPPFLAADCCTDYARDFSLTDDQISAVVEWGTGDAEEGDPATYVPPTPRETGLPRVDETITMPEPYTPTLADGETDVSRCFLLDWPDDADPFVTGLGVVPGNEQIVHHAILLVAGPEVVAGFEALDAADAGPGWTCPGGAVLGYTGWIGGWSPGWDGQEVPEGLGQPVEAGSKLILSVHYSVVEAAPGPDQTTVQLMTAESVEGSLKSFGVYDPAWVSGGMPIPADDPEVVYTYSWQPGLVDRTTSRLLAANLHMHERGARGQVGILRADGSTECLLQIDRWDYGWQFDYVFAEPKDLGPDDSLFVECIFDNTAGNQRIVGGQRETPRDLNWAEDEEMCVAFVTARQ